MAAKKAGVSPQAPTLLDEWDVVRAAQHMIEVHGKQAIEIAQKRSEASVDVELMKRWRAIAATIREMQDGSGDRG